MRPGRFVRLLLVEKTLMLAEEVGGAPFRDALAGNAISARSARRLERLMTLPDPPTNCPGL